MACRCGTAAQSRDLPIHRPQQLHADRGFSADNHEIHSAPRVKSDRVRRVRATCARRVRARRRLSAVCEDLNVMTIGTTAEAQSNAPLAVEYTCACTSRPVRRTRRRANAKRAHCHEPLACAIQCARRKAWAPRGRMVTRLDVDEDGGGVRARHARGPEERAGVQKAEWCRLRARRAHAVRTLQAAASFRQHRAVGCSRVHAVRGTAGSALGLCNSRQNAHALDSTMPLHANAPTAVPSLHASKHRLYVVLSAMRAVTAGPVEIRQWPNTVMGPVQAAEMDVHSHDSV